MKAGKRTLRALLVCGISLFSEIACLSQNPGPEWKLESNVAAENIYCVRVIDNRLYAGSNGRLSISNPDVGEWMTITVPGSNGDVEDLIKYNGKLFMASYGQGVLASDDGGITWQTMDDAGPFPIGFAQANGQLYVATGDRGALRLGGKGSQWQSFNEGLYDRIESAFDCLTSANGTLVGGVSANGAIALRGAGSQRWQVIYPSGRMSPGATTFDLLYAAGRIWAFTNQNVLVSGDQGVTWGRAGNGLPLGIDSKGLAVGDSVYAAINSKNGSSVIYRRPAASGNNDQWTPFDTLEKVYIHSMASLNGKLYVGTQRGLYSMLIRNAEPDTPENPGISVYPNPARILVNVATPGAAKGLFELYAPDGRRVLTQRVYEKIMQLDVSKLPGGQYVYRFSGMEKGYASGKLLISN